MTTVTLNLLDEADPSWGFFVRPVALVLVTTSVGWASEHQGCEPDVASQASLQQRIERVLKDAMRERQIKDFFIAIPPFTPALGVQLEIAVRAIDEQDSYQLTVHAPVSKPIQLIMEHPLP